MKAYFKVKGKPNEIKVSVGYELGGRSYLSGENSSRGYYAYVHPVERNEHSESMILFEGFKVMLKEVNRKHKKSEAYANEKAKTMLKDLAEKMATQKGWELADNAPEIIERG